MVTDAPEAKIRPESGETTEGQPARIRRGRLSTNLLANLANFGVQILVGIFFTPYLVHSLGIAAYGLIPLCVHLAFYMGVVTQSFNSAQGRFLTIAVERDDHHEASRIFNTSLFTTVAMVAALVPLVHLAATNVESLIDVPIGFERAAKWLLLSSGIMFLLMTSASPFQVATYCQNRFDIRAIIDVLSAVTRVAVILVLFEFITPKLDYAGAGYAVAGLVLLGGSIIAWRRLLPQLSIDPRRFDLSMLRQLWAMGGWMAINAAGSILFLQIDLIVVNRVVGAEAGGNYAVVLQWSTMLRAFGYAVAAVFGPTIVYFYARKDLDGLVTYARRSVKIVGLAVALPVGLVCGFSKPLLTVWLGEEFAFLAPLMSLITAHLCINLGYLPLHQITIATKNVRWPGIASLLMGAANLTLALILAGPLVGWGMYGVAVAGAITLTAKNILFTPLYCAYVLKKPMHTFFRELLPTSLATAFLAAGGWWLSSVISIDGWLQLIGAGTVAGLVYIGFAWIVLLRRDERAQLIAGLRRNNPERSP